jgi:hypothetical protein
MTSYDVIEYWNKRDNPNSKNPNERNTLKHISFVKKNIHLNDKILDYGPGIGRILPAYGENNKITGYDVSSKYKERLLETARQKKIELDLIIDKAILTEFSFNNNEFDVAVSISVLLHQPPKDIVNIMCLQANPRCASTKGCAAAAREVTRDVLPPHGKAGIYDHTLAVPPELRAGGCVCAHPMLSSRGWDPCREAFVEGG